MQTKFAGESHCIFYQIPVGVEVDLQECDTDHLQKLKTWLNDKEKLEKDTKFRKIKFTKVLFTWAKPNKLKIEFTVVYQNKISKLWYPWYYKEETD